MNCFNSGELAFRPRLELHTHIIGRGGDLGGQQGMVPFRDGCQLSLDKISFSKIKTIERVVGGISHA